MSDAEPRNPFTRRGFILGAVLVGGLAAASIALAVTAPHDSNPAPASSSGAASTPMATATIDPAASSVCGLPGYDTTNTLTTAPPTKWSIVGTVAAPESDSAGPGITGKDGFRSCYAHTVQGALFSAANFVAMSSDSRITGRLTEMVAPGPGRDVAIKAANPDAGQSSVRYQVAGFTVTAYTADTATIDLAVQVTTSGGQLVSFPTALAWVDGDWKIVLADNGQPVFAASPLQSLGGYTAWSGV